MRNCIVWTLLAITACSDDEPTLIDGVFTDAEWGKVQEHSPLPPPPADTTNAYADDPKAAALGHMLFFEKSYAGPIAVGSDGANGGLGAVGETGKISCASCHVPSTWFMDSRSNPATVALGADWGGRNAMMLVNAAYHTPFQHWDGRFDTAFGPALGPAENPKSVNSTRLTIAHMLWNKYRNEYNDVFEPDLDPGLVDYARFPATGKPKLNAMAPDGAWELMKAEDRAIVNRIFANWGKAIAAHVRRLRSTSTPFDAYVAGDTGAISRAAKRGLKLFIGKAACDDCHEGPAFTDNKFHNIGVPQTGERVPAMDDGRFAAVTPLLAHAFNSSGAFSDDPNTGRLTGVVAGDEAVRGAFLTPMLRNCFTTGPFMHSGQVATLEDVIELYNKGGETTGFSGTVDEKIVPLDLTAQEKADLIEFLSTLDGEPVESGLLVDRSKP